MTPELLDKLNKIKALAERGYAGEKLAAEQMLAKLMEKYGVDESDLTDTVTKEHEFRFWGQFGDRLFTQVVYSILPEATILHYKYKRNCHSRFVTCTEAEAIQIKETFEFYRNHLDEGLKNYYTAFICAEEIFPENPPENDKASGVISRDARRLAHVLDKHERRLMLEDGE